MTVTVTCVGCQQPFEAKSKRAKWHSPACKKRAQREGRAGATAEPEAKPAAEPEAKPAAEKKTPAEPSALVESVTKELVDAGVLDSFPGQLALQLARRLSSPEESGVSALSKELRTVMAAALEGRTPPPGEGEGAAPAEQDDEVTRARKAREAKAREAASRA